MGKSTNMAIFNSYVSHYQRVERPPTRTSGEAPIADLLFVVAMMNHPGRFLKSDNLEVSQTWATAPNGWCFFGKILFFHGKSHENHPSYFSTVTYPLVI